MPTTATPAPAIWDYSVEFLERQTGICRIRDSSLAAPLTISSLAKLVATDTSPATNCDNQK